MKRIATRSLVVGPHAHHLGPSTLAASLRQRSLGGAGEPTLVHSASCDRLATPPEPPLRAVCSTGNLQALRRPDGDASQRRVVVRNTCSAPPVAVSDDDDQDRSRVVKVREGTAWREAFDWRRLDRRIQRWSSARLLNLEGAELTLGALAHELQAIIAVVDDCRAHARCARVLCDMLLADPDQSALAYRVWERLGRDSV